jgi:hypothetical protein
MFPGRGVVKTYYFAIDFEVPSSTASGLGSGLIFENKQLANSKWQLAEDGTWYLVFGKRRCNPLPTWDWDWVTHGSPKRDPRVTQASRKGHPSVDSENPLCLQQKLKNDGVGVGGVGWAEI